jgi:hypothetical protein
MHEVKKLTWIIYDESLTPLKSITRWVIATVSTIVELGISWSISSRLIKLTLKCTFRKDQLALKRGWTEKPNITIAYGWERNAREKWTEMGIIGIKDQEVQLN